MVAADAAGPVDCPDGHALRGAVLNPFCCAGEANCCAGCWRDVAPVDLKMPPRVIAAVRALLSSLFIFGWGFSDS